MMSNGLAKVAKTAKDKSAEINSAFKSVEGGIDRATEKNKKFARSFEEVAQKTLSLKNIVKQAGIGLSLAGLIAFTKNSLAESALAENQKIAFKVLTGDKFQGDALYGNIRHMADTTPFESRELMTAGKMLLGFGEQKGKIMPDLKALGDIASAQEDSTQSLLGLAHAYGEVIASGRLLGRNTLEMINWGFNPLKEISIMTGKSMEELKKTEERGAISAEMVRKAFEHATAAGGKYHDMMKEQASTLSGQWSTFMDLVHAKMRSFGDSLAPVAKSLMAFASKVLEIGSKSQLDTFLDETRHLRALQIEYGLINTSNERRVEIFKEIRANYPDIVANIKNEKDAIDKLIPSLDKYLGKRYMAAGVLKIKEQYAEDLQAVEEANRAMSETHGQATAMAAMLADKYNVSTSGLSAGQLQAAVMSKMAKQAGPKINAVIVAGGGSVNPMTDTQRDLAALQNLLAQNKAAQDLYNTHIGGANKAQKAIEQFNRVMGIKPDAAGGGAGGGDREPGAGMDIAGGIAQGGPRVININGGVKFTDKFEMHVTEFKGGVKQVEEAFQDLLLRVLNSGASVQQ